MRCGSLHSKHELNLEPPQRLPPICRSDRFFRINISVVPSPFLSHNSSKYLALLRSRIPEKKNTASPSVYRARNPQLSSSARSIREPNQQPTKAYVYDRTPAVSIKTRKLHLESFHLSSKPCSSKHYLLSSHARTLYYHYLLFSSLNINKIQNMTFQHSLSLLHQSLRSRPPATTCLACPSAKQTPKPYEPKIAPLPCQLLHQKRHVGTSSASLSS